MNPKIEEILKALRFEASIYVGSSTSAVCAAAADLIEQLQQELSKLKAQQRWIPVTERLPEDDDDVLIMSSGSISMGYYSVCNEYWADYINVYYDDVTHWMPLPKPPKECDEHE